MYGSSGINDWTGNPATSSKPKKFEKEGNEAARYWATSSVPGAGQVPLFLSALWLGGKPNDTDQPPEWEEFTYTDTALWGAMTRFAMTRHKGENQNALFVDFSVRSVGVKELWTLKWNKWFDIRNDYTLAGGAIKDTWPEWMQSFKDY
jgi:hypothetical protein